MNSHKQTKRALLTSVMALVMCVVMLVGTTFAWFTDTATANVNKIQAGNLDVALYYGNAADGAAVTEWKKLDNNSAPLSFLQSDGTSAAQKDFYWEPGGTYSLPALKVVNEGNLNLKYKIEITGIKGSAKLNKVIDWTMKLGSDEFVIGSEHVLNAPEVGKESAAILTISGKMQETAGNTYMNEKIDGIAITLKATQAVGEYDSNDDQYDKDAQYPSVVTVTPNTIPSPFEANTTYFFAAGNYGDQHFVITDKENVTLIGKTGAAFDSLKISSIDYVNSSIGQEVDLDNSTLTVKGFKVTNVLDITVSDKNIVVEDNTAGSIKIKTNVSCDNLVVNNNALTGGDLGGGSVIKYGVYVVPNITDYNLTVTNNTFDNIVKHAIGVQGCGDGQAVTAAKSITVEGNKFNSYGTDKDNRAAFKIWADTKLAPNDTDPLNEAAKALAKAVEDNNAFSNELDSTCVVADFYGKTVAFN